MISTVKEKLKTVTTVCSKSLWEKTYLHLILENRFLNKSKALGKHEVVDKCWKYAKFTEKCFERSLVYR